MKKLPIKILLLIIFPSVLLAQEIETSPYSAFGLGEKKYSGPAESVSMGGLNSIFWDNVHVNPMNPASYSFLSVTTFAIGGQGRTTELQNTEETEKSTHVGVNHLLIGIPMGKWGAAFGFMPSSSTGYSVNSEEKLNDQSLIIDNPNNPSNPYYDGDYSNYYSFNGFGGVNRAFIGFSYSPFRGFSVGVNANYQFGNISRSVRMYTPPVTAKIPFEGDDETLVDQIVYEGSQYGTKYDEKLRLNDWQFDMGVLYTGEFTDKLHYTLGTTFGLGNSTELEYTKYLYSFKFKSNGAEIPVDTLQSVSGSHLESGISLPAYGSAGLSIGNYSKWMVGVNYEFSEPSNLEINSGSYDVIHKRHQKYSIGGYFTPKFNSINRYWQRVTYRGGFKYEELGLNINGVDIIDYSINFGFGFPVGNGASNISLGGAFGTRGTTDANLIKENYFNFVVAFSLSDKWFKKNKFY
ncbi:MAG: hypothetical protein KAH10_09060 [Flavobacteriales bacterium]|nr:hypothetical protein [Flavobacteriales bacterium]